MRTTSSAARTSQARTQQYAFPTVKLSYVRDFSGEPLPKITSGYQAYQYMKHLFDDCRDHYEEFHILLLNRNNEVLGTYQVGKGGLTATIADPRLIMQAAILANASGVVLAHNHPSGQMKASVEDIRLTFRIEEIMKLCDIALIDHLIISGHGFYSLKEHGHF